MTTLAGHTQNTLFSTTDGYRYGYGSMWVYRSYIGPISVLYWSYIGPISVLYQSYICPISVLYRSILVLYRSYISPISVLYQSYISPILVIVQYQIQYVIQYQIQYEPKSAIFYFSELPKRLGIGFSMWQTCFAKGPKASDPSLFIQLDMQEIQYEKSFLEKILENSPDIQSQSYWYQTNCLVEW